ncbi:UNVERIFIED_CONTAM: hypothetical protein Slati_3056100 [Sesamum latifolium]|uniref:Rx N-terminal domain-containing protein n=1 Tax=Sesamum latifolium TaxID=2727402 RepID=A0AAW2UV44_9LAMI
MAVEEELSQFVEKGLREVSHEVSCLTDVVDFKLENLKTDIMLVKKAVAGNGTEGSAIASKV